MLGRASASANSRITAQRSASSSQCRSRTWRRLALSRSLMNRSAGNSRCSGCLRMIRCSTIGTATASAAGQKCRVQEGHLRTSPRRLTRYSVSARSNCMLVSSGT